MSIEYKKGSLFEAPPGSVLVHACNAQGVWGSGIAAEFKKRFPKSFEEYRRFCESHSPRSDAVGQYFESSEGIVCLITSENYGDKVDPPGRILENTLKALAQLVREQGLRCNVHSNKFNSGLFNVPWEFTEAAIRVSYDLSTYSPWTVWDPDL